MRSLSILVLTAMVLTPSSRAQQILVVPSMFSTISQAIAAAVPGDTVAVLPGTYNEMIDFLGKAITVTSTNGPEVTIIDRFTTGRCARFVNNEGPTSILDGFTLTRGRAPDAAPVMSGPGLPGGDGGGILCRAQATIRNCIIRHNAAGNGSNGSFFEPGGRGGRGGGIFVTRSATIMNCVIRDNEAGTAGQVFFPGIPGEGAGIAAAGLSGVQVNLANCTIVGNGVASSTDGGLVMDGLPGATLFATNSIVRGNSGPEVSTGAIVVSFCNVEGGAAGILNIDVDPLFVDPGPGDYRLAPGSPCFGVGFNGVPGLPVTDIDGTGRILYGVVDMGAYESVDFTASPCAGGNVGVVAGGPFDVLAIDGTAGGPARRVQVGVNTPFTFSVLQPPTNGAPAGFVVFGLIGVPGLNDPVSLPFGLGSMCFDPCPSAGGQSIQFTLTDNLQLPVCAPLVSSTPTPWFFAAPGLPVAITATFQGLILDTLASVAVTNAVVLEVL